jgi:hypothetical protein
MAGIAHLAQAIDALVGVDAEDGVVIVAGDHGKAQVSDLESRRLRERADSVFNPI